MLLLTTNNRDSWQTYLCTVHCHVISFENFLDYNKTWEGNGVVGDALASLVALFQTK